MTPEDYQQVYTLKTVQFTTFAFYVSEVLAALIALGPRRFFKLSAWNSFDCFVIVTASSTIALECCYDDRTHALVLGIMFLRCAKILRIMKAIPGFSSLITAIVAVVPSIWRYAAVLGLLVYSVAGLGVLLFKDRTVSSIPPQSTTSAYYLLGLTQLNFDNLGSAIFTVSAQSGPWWPAVMEAVIKGWGSRGPRVYFYSLWFGGLVLGNFTFAFMLDAYAVQRKLGSSRRAMQRIAEEEAGGHGHGHGGGGGAWARGKKGHATHAVVGRGAGGAQEWDAANKDSAGAA